MRQDQQHDAARKAAILVEAAGILGEALTRERIAGYLRVLADVPAGDLQAAVDAHLRDPVAGRWWPKPADLLAKLPRRDLGHPPGDVAWGIALRGLDEGLTQVTTRQILRALGLARPVLDAGPKGDVVGGRKAFLEAYAMITASEPPDWLVSQGHDRERRADVIFEAVAAGLLSQERARTMLPPPQSEAGPVVAVAGLLAGRGDGGTVVQWPADRMESAQASKTRQRWEEARQAALDGQSRREAAERWRRDEAKRQEEARRAELARQAEGGR